MQWTRSSFRTKESTRTLGVEALERRDCAVVSAGVFGHTLFVRGDANANVITITDDGKGAVSAKIDGVSASGTGITHIMVEAGAGNDSLTYTLGGPLAGEERLLADLGSG